MKTINNEAILDLIYDLADENGLRIGEFIERIEEEFGEQPIDTSGLPDRVIAELEAAKGYKNEQRTIKRKKQQESDMQADIKRFRELFPDTSAEEIPDSVWAEVENGVPLAHAFALYTVTQQSIQALADEVNRRNGNASAAATNEGTSEPLFTKEAVEKMSQKDIKSNYKNILKAMKSWRV